MRDAWPDRAAARATGAAAAGVVQLGVPPAGAGRWGLVLGGGGVLGAAWLIGALGALERATGLDARQADLILGTSAGSVIGALLASGMSVAEQREQQVEQAGRRDVFDPDRPLAAPERAPRPRLRPGSPELLRTGVRQRLSRRLGSMPATAVLTALAPQGTARLPAVARLIEALVPAGEWPAHAGLRVVALDYATGRRVRFGAPEAPRAGLSAAVLASCAIPGWFAPVEIGGRRYVDGGAWSSTNADLAADAGLDRLFVLAPMVSTAYDRPPDWKVRTERRVRIAITRRCLVEARQVHAAGTAVTVLGPGPPELAMIGYNLMAAAPRREVLRSAEVTVAAALQGLERV